ncbi:casein kinase I isoform delta [Cordyceps fumosorosea ARSEF 2679]|uniref:non-specific serine/threonine protein kinase n=1 Tax=Cordyceps fumosorosea (strain ARSEF 2679) TaxID=1081104 RepID=A0A162JLI6_CORFA|nr:casein kinase I isoform delta [Cordyceps fumosorosea ARSEF 2679]OAA70712.1 casein kinase I isoform delta [Cordyceps fumosorosea ARSEF 2679]
MPVRTDLVSDEKVAVKLVHIRGDPELLRLEKDIYRDLAGGVGVPEITWFGEECDYYCLVCELLGPSLEDLFNYCDRKFSLKTVLLLADQAIARVKHFHDKGYLHRDFKPENMLMGSGKRGNILYIIDFGLARECHDTDRYMGFENIPFGGTARYASLNNHNGREQSWGDDLESLGYVLLYLARGSLPWQGMEVEDGEDKNKMIGEMKLTVPVETLCEGLPEEFATYITYTRSLGFQEKPKYAYLRCLFRRAFSALGFQYDNVFDWTEKLYYELQAEMQDKIQRKIQRDMEGELQRDIERLRLPGDDTSSVKRRTRGTWDERRHFAIRRTQ